MSVRSCVGSAAATLVDPGVLSRRVVEVGPASDSGTASEVGNWVTGATSTVLTSSLSKAGAKVGCTDAESVCGCSSLDVDSIAEGSGSGNSLGALIGAPDSFDGPAGSGMDSAASRAGDSGTGLGIVCSTAFCWAFASSLRDSLEDLEGVPGLVKLIADDDRLIMVPMRDRRDFAGDEV